MQDHPLRKNKTKKENKIGFMIIKANLLIFHNHIIPGQYSVQTGYNILQCLMITSAPFLQKLWLNK